MISRDKNTSGSVKLVREKAVSNFSVDPKLDKTEAFKIPGVRMLVLGSPLNNQEFIRAARLAFSHSKQRDPECRYNVQVKVGPNEPASFILLIEKYFYKSII